MKFSGLIPSLRYYWQFNPLRLNALLFLAIAVTSARWLHMTETETSSFQGILMLMAKIALAFSVFIISLSFLSSLFCFLYFIYQKKKRGHENINIIMDAESSDKHTLRIQTLLPFALKPILGFVKVRLIYDKSAMTEKYIVADRMRRKFFTFNTGLCGKNTLLLPDIKEYSFSNALISFEDMLQFFTFTVNTSTEQTICNLPHSLLQDTDELPPKKTEEEKVRIEQLRKVEGELLSYKKFEDSDDVRRIVWKIFAKNKELVVRVPETMDPFASHIYLYASFYTTQPIALFPGYEQEMLNHYKNSVWTIYDALRNKEFEVRYQSDQEIANPNPEIDTTQYAITLSAWHHDKTLADYFKPRNGSVLCIHSFTSPKELEQMLAASDSHTTVFFIQLSKVFKSHYLLNWVLRIFFKPKSDRLTALRNKWAIHPLKFKTTNNEKALLSLLKKSDLNTEII
ncbi:hypothetical protein EMGBS15_03470 [Filimonas sp.]|nr:hypothetical protein EMGBS15_03470 [Filimonas sp.]